MRAKQWRQGIVVGVLLVVAFWLASLTWGLLGKAEIAVTQAHDARAQLAALESRKQVLEGNIATLSTPLGKDAAIRQAFGVAKPGEEVIVVVPPAAPTSTPAVPWWQRVLNWF